MRTGLEICYDVRFGELSRALAVAGAELLVLPAAWAAGPFKEEHWVTLVRARAIENTVWVAAVGQVPDPDEPRTRAATGIGRSMLVDPLGVVRLDLGPAAGVAVGEVDTGLVGTVRATVPSLANRREDVFGKPVAVPGWGLSIAASADRRLPEDRLLAAWRGGEADAGQRVARAVRPVMAWMPGPVRPCPPGVTAFQADPLAEVHTTTSWWPGWRRTSRWRVNSPPAPAAVPSAVTRSAVTNARPAGPAGRIRSRWRRRRTSSPRTAAAGPRW